MTPSRRQFIQTGIAGSLLLTFSGWFNQPFAAMPRRLSDNEREMLTAITAVFLDGALPKNSEARQKLVARTVDGISKAVAGLSLSTQKEIGELFGLLVLTPARRVLAGIGKPWREADANEIAGFLEAWRSSRLGLLQSAYAALHDLIFGAWYAQPDSWEAIGYPGPPEVF
jgi:hypothetical protein